MRIDKLSTALEISEEARVVTVGSAPFRIVHTNKGRRKARLSVFLHLIAPPLPRR